MRFPQTTLILMIIVGFLGGTSVFAAPAATSGWIETDQSRIRLISEYDGVKGHKSLRIGLQVQLRPGWKIYWRSPGDAGIPPQFDWSGSVNFKQNTLHWPLPEQFDSFGLSTWGYHDEVVYPIEVTLADPDKPLDLKLRLFFGICEQVCIPYEHELVLRLDNMSGEVTPEASLIEDFVKRVPPQIGADGVEITLATAKLLDDQHFSVTARSAASFTKPDIIVEGEEGAYFSVISRTISDDGKSVIFNISADLPGKTDRLKGQNIVVTVIDENTAAEGPLAVEE